MRSREKAFTMVEILVSLLILALILSGLVNIFIASQRHTLHRRSVMAAAELARYFLDPLQMDVRQDQWGSNCLSTDGTNTGGCNTTPQSLNGITYTPQYDKSPVAGTTLRRVKLTVKWSEPSP